MAGSREARKRRRPSAKKSFSVWTSTIEFRCHNALDSSLWVGQPRSELIARFDEPLSAWHIHTRPTIAMNKLVIRPRAAA